MRKAKLRAMLAAVTVGVGFGWAIGGAVDAQADTTDDVFIEVLDDQGIGYTTRADAIRAGKSVCIALDSGTRPMTVILTVSSATGLSVPTSGYFVGVSIAAYCPWQLAAVGVEA